MKATRLLGVLAVLQAGILVGQLTGGRSTTSTAYGQAFDASAQRAQVVEELRTMNGKMDKLMDLLSSGKLQVKVAPPDEKDK